MFSLKERGFTLAELLVVILVIAVLSTMAFTFFQDRVALSEDSVSGSNVRSAISAIQTEYAKHRGSYTSGPLATGATAQERANNFARAAIEQNSNMKAIVSVTPPEGTIGVQMSANGKSGTLYIRKGAGDFEQVDIRS